MEYYTPAVVLNRFDVRDADRIISLYTSQIGKVAVLSRGSRQVNSKMSGMLEPFAVLAVKIVDGRRGPTLSNVETIKRYQYILTDHDLINLAGGCLSLVDKLVKENIADEELLNLLKKILSVLDRSDISLEKKKFLASVWRLQLVSHLGYRPELQTCVVCRQDLDGGVIGFDVSRGGLICHRHQPLVRSINIDQIKLLRLISEQDINFFADKKISKKLAQSVEPIINEFVATVAG